MVYTTYKNGDLGDGLSLFYPTYCNYSYTSIFLGENLKMHGYTTENLIIGLV